MAIGDDFGRGYQAGRGIGDDLSRWRMSRGEQKLREEFEQRAAEEGRNLEDYIPEIESRLQALYESSGSAKRGITGAYGRSPVESQLDQYRRRASEGIGRRASAALETGDVAGSRRVLARGMGQMGDYDASLANYQAGDQVEAVNAGVGRGVDGGFDSAGASGRMAGVLGKYGDIAGASGAQNASEQFRTQNLQVLGGRMATMLENPQAFGNDQMRGTFEAMKPYLPSEYAAFDIQLDDNNVPVLYNGGTPVGDLSDPDERSGVIDMLTQLAKDPSTILSQRESIRTANAAHARDRREAAWDTSNEAAAAMIQEFVKAGVDAKALEDVQSTRQQAMQAGGWTKLDTIGEDGSIAATDRNGNLITIHPGRASGVDGQMLPGMTIRDAAGNVLNPDDIAGGAALTQYAQATAELAAQARSRMSADALLTGLRLLGTIGGGAWSAEGAESALPRRRGGDRPQFQNLRDAVEWQESRGNPNAVSPKGALGRMQTMPGTLRDPGYGITPARDDSDAERTRVGNEYLQAMLDKYGDERLALAAYNWGPGSVDRALQAAGGDVDAMLARAPRETQNYVSSILSSMQDGAPAAPAAGRAPPQQRTAALPAAPQRSGLGNNAAALTQGRQALERAVSELNAWQEELAAFDQQATRTAIPQFGGRGPGLMSGNRARVMSPELRAQREALQARATKAEQTVRMLAQELRSAAGASQQQAQNTRQQDVVSEAERRVAQRLADGNTAGGGGNIASQSIDSYPEVADMLRKQFGRR